MDKAILIVLAILALIGLIVLIGDEQIRTQIGQDLGDIGDSLTRWLGALFRRSGTERSTEMDRASRQGNDALRRLGVHFLDLLARIWAYLVAGFTGFWQSLRFSIES